MLNGRRPHGKKTWNWDADAKVMKDGRGDCTTSPINQFAALLLLHRGCDPVVRCLNITHSLPSSGTKKPLLVLGSDVYCPISVILWLFPANFGLVAAGLRCNTRLYCQCKYFGREATCFSLPMWCRYECLHLLATTIRKHQTKWLTEILLS